MSARIALLMDHGRDDRYHAATAGALRAAGATVEWVHTGALADVGARDRTAACDGILLGPGSPYAGKEGVLALVRRAREELIPFVGT